MIVRNGLYLSILLHVCTIEVDGFPMLVSVVRVDCIPVNKKVKSHICEELLPNETAINLYNLCEHTEYDIVITAVTDEFFESLPSGHEWKRERQIPQNNVEIPDSEWLPKSTITVSSWGSFPSVYVTYTLLLPFVLV